MKCPECGAEMRLTDEPLETKVHNNVFTVHGIEHLQCDDCGEDIVDAENLKKLSDEGMRLYREMSGLLSPEDIKRIRVQCGLSQKQFEAVLGVTSPTVSRWETGTVIQSKPLDNLMRMFRNHKCVADDLMRRAEVKPMAAASTTVCIALRDLLRTEERKTERKNFNYVR